MPIEQRVVSGAKIGGNRIGGGSAPRRLDAEAERRRRSARAARSSLLVVVRRACSRPAVPPRTSCSAVARCRARPRSRRRCPAPSLTVEPVSLNLADGHYLRLGMALQLTAGRGDEAPDTARALDLAIALFSGRTVAEVSDPATRDALDAPSWRASSRRPTRAR